jgi:hypothetical protein
MHLKKITIFKKPSRQLKKASISLKMSSKRIEILKKSLKFFFTKSLKLSENIATHFKKKLHGNIRITAMASLPLESVQVYRVFIHFINSAITSKIVTSFSYKVLVSCSYILHYTLGSIRTALKFKSAF